MLKLYLVCTRTWAKPGHCAVHHSSVLGNTRLHNPSPGAGAGQGWTYGWMASLLLTLQSELSDMAGLVRVLLGVLLPGAGYVGRCGSGRCG